MHLDFLTIDLRLANMALLIKPGAVVKLCFSLPFPQDSNALHLLKYVAIAAGEMLHVAEPFLERNLHPTVIIQGFVRALEDAVKVIEDLSFPVDVDDRDQMLKIISSCIGTKFTSRFGTLMPVSLPVYPAIDLTQPHLSLISCIVDWLLAVVKPCARSCPTTTQPLLSSWPSLGFKQSWRHPLDRTHASSSPGHQSHDHVPL